MLRFKRLGVRDSPLIPFHTGSRLPSKRPGKARSAVQKWTLYAVVVFVLLAGGYSLRNGAGTSPKSSGKERSGRTLAEQLEQQQDSNVASAITDENTVQLHKQARHGLRSYAGREHKLQEGTYASEHAELSADSNNDSLSAQAVDAKVVQPILETYAVAADAVANAAESVQQSAGQVDPAANLVAQEVQLNQAPANIQPESAAAKQIDKNTLARTELPPATGLYSAKMKSIDGQEVDLRKYEGNVSLVVNVASQCGYTESNYKGLNQLYDLYHSRGFEILAFPCNSWNQETASDSEINTFARHKHGAKFPIFAKVEAIGPNAHPIFPWLSKNLPDYELTGWEPEWNFSKWLVDRNGLPVKAYRSEFDMNALSTDIEKLLRDGHLRSVAK